jgi:hypothetical protein
MKLLYTMVLMTLIVGCKKERTDSPTGCSSSTAAGLSLQNLKNDLKGSMLAQDFDSLDFTRAIYNQVDSVGLYYLRVPFKGGEVAKEFTLLKLDKTGRVNEGKIIQLDGGVIEAGAGTVKVREWEGKLSISSLNRRSLVNSTVHKGYIDAFHPLVNVRQTVYGSDELPEVIVVAYVSSGIDYSAWVNLTSLFYSGGGSGGDGSGGYYGSLDGGSGVGSYGGTTGGSYGSGGEGSTGVTVDETMLVDVDTYVDHPAVDVGQYLKCFDGIADAGAVCEVGIYSDVPVDSDPNKIFDFSTGSPGHTFIQIKKTSADGSKSIIQNIGFYPKAGFKTALTNAPVDAKFVDDADHEFNAGYTKSLTPDEFRSILTEILYLKNIQYDIDNFNCTDWALDIFNKQGYGLDIPLYDIPGNLPTTGTSMPQGVYNKLAEMKKNNDAHTDNIQIGFLKAWVANSNGPCN